MNHNLSPSYFKNEKLQNNNDLKIEIKTYKAKIHQ